MPIEHPIDDMSVPEIVQALKKHPHDDEGSFRYGESLLIRYNMNNPDDTHLDFAVPNGSSVNVTFGESYTARFVNPVQEGVKVFHKLRLLEYFRDLGGRLQEVVGSLDDKNKWELTFVDNIIRNIKTMNSTSRSPFVFIFQSHDKLMDSIHAVVSDVLNQHPTINTKHDVDRIISKIDAILKDNEVVSRKSIGPA